MVIFLGMFSGVSQTRDKYRQIRRLGGSSKITRLFLVVFFCSKYFLWWFWTNVKNVPSCKQKNVWVIVFWFTQQISTVTRKGCTSIMLNIPQRWVKHSLKADTFFSYTTAFWLYLKNVLLIHLECDHCLPCKKDVKSQWAEWQDSVKTSNKGKHSETIILVFCGLLAGRDINKIIRKYKNDPV